MSDIGKNVSSESFEVCKGYRGDLKKVGKRAKMVCEITFPNRIK